MTHKSKKQKHISEIIEKKNIYTFNKAIELIKNLPKAKFAENIEASIQLSVNPKKKKIHIKGYSILPNDTEKKYKIAVFSTDNEAIKNIKNTAMIIKEENLEHLTKKNLNFDLIITTPSSIGKIGKLNKVLNAKKIMPDIKYGTLTTNLETTLEKLKKNYIRFKNEKNDIIHCLLGKMNLDTQKLKENIEVIINDIKKSKPKDCKNITIKKISISSTMGPGLKINLNSLNF